MTFCPPFETPRFELRNSLINSRVDDNGYFSELDTPHLPWSQYYRGPPRGGGGVPVPLFP